jgi:ADP-ribose pyrophosphatase
VAPDRAAQDRAPDRARDREGPEESRIAFRGRYLEAVVERWSGSEYEFVRRIGPAGAGAVGVLALTASEDVLLVRQLREPVRREMLEIPAGLRDVEGETPEECARRELLEETGYPPARIEPLGRGFFSSSGLTDERYILFRADVQDAPSSDPEAGIDLVRMPLREALREVEGGGIEDAKTALALLLASRTGG